MRQFILIIVISISWPGFLHAQHYTPEAKEIYSSIMRLEFQDARKQLREFDSSNVVHTHLENYIHFFELFIGEDEALYEEYHELKNQRLNYIAANGDRSSPYYLFIQADIRLQWALVEAKFRDFYAAFRDIKHAYTLLEENHRRYPSFRPNEKNRGILIALVGTLPDKYKWGFEWLSGIPGDIYKGEAMLEQCLNGSDFVFADETRVMYALLQLHLLNNEKKAWDVLQDVSISPEESGLVTFLLANTALNTKRPGKARGYLKNFKKTEKQFEFPHLEYLRGFVEMYDGQYEQAIVHFRAFLNDFDGLHYIKSAWLNMGFCYYILGRKQPFMDCLSKCKTEGDYLIDEDKYALNFAREGKVLPVPLLKARLFFDGGNYEKAMEVLDAHSHTYERSSPHFKVLTYYRARTLHEQGKLEKALETYGFVLNLPHPEREYYGANTALHMGLIYEERGECKLARHYYQRCLDIPAEEYRSGLHQKAKAGLLRCKN